MSYPLRHVVNVLLLVSVACPAIAAEEAVTIMQVGEHHGKEMPKPTKQPWFALIQQDGSTRLSRVKPRIKTVFDPILDDSRQPARFSGVSVAVAGVAPQLLIQMKGLRAGPVTTADLAPAEGDIQHLNFKGSDYQIRHQCGEVDAATLLKTCQVILVTPGGEQVFTTTQEGDSDDAVIAYPTWAGDIDGDGKLDLLMTTGARNRSGMALFLSSRALPGKLLAPAATLTATGC